MLLNISVFISPTPFLDSMDKKKNFIVLIFLIVILFAVNYSYLDSALEAFFYGSEIVFVDRVIDGDTFVVNSSSVRLLGINCPEKGERLYSEAGDFLSDFVLNESARLVRGNEDTDRYARLLRYVFVDDVNVNLELVRNGYANFYFPGGKDFCFCLE
jgi:endonuclease YncB( thermonuclease family)